jgi:hypothetical protein
MPAKTIASQKKSVEDVSRVTNLKPPSETLTPEGLRDFLFKHKVPQSLAWAVRLNPSDESPRKHPDKGIRFGVPGRPTLRHFSASIVEWAITDRREGPSVRLHGKRQNDADAMGIGRSRGLFDYEYDLSIPLLSSVRDGKGEDDFHLDREGRIEASYTTHSSQFNFDSNTSSEVDAVQFVGLLGEASLELIGSIKDARHRSSSLQGLSDRVSEMILGIERQW